MLGYSSDSSEDTEEPAKKSQKKSGKSALDSDQEEEEEEDEDVEGWGTSKRDYYNADNIETEADALEEEAEAKRIQQKKLQKMSEADFGFDENDWLDTEKDGDEDGAVTEVLKDVEITEDMGSEERRRLLNIRYPEFDQFADEFLDYQPTLRLLQVQAEQPNATPITIAKHRALAAYISSLAMYFAILTSTANERGESKALDSLELHDHQVMDCLLRCRELWTKANNLKVTEAISLDDEAVSSDEEESADEVVIKPVKARKSKKQIAAEAAAMEAKAQRAKRIRQAEEGLADLSNLISKPSKKTSKKRVEIAAADDDSDFGEEGTMDAREAAEKAQKKKSLRFYTSQIAQKANKRAGAGRDAGGDADLPYRERLRDREARLMAEAEKRGRLLDNNGRGDKTALGGDSDEDEADKATAAAMRDDENEYYDMVANASKTRKAEKAARFAAYATATAEGKLVREVEGEIGEDGKRAIGYVIQKNKGLAPKRKKEVRNPRVKKRMKYEAKMKQLSSTKAVYKGGESKGGYGGEMTGIKTGLVKSTKL